MSLFLILMSLLSMMFAAPAQQSASNDVGIKNSAASLLARVYEFSANNNGRIPSHEEFESLVKEGDYRNPLTDSLYKEEIYFPGKDCSGKSSPRLSSIKVKLTDGSEYCVD